MATVDIECVCPKTPHKGDTVTLREKLDFHSALTIRNAFAWLRSQDADASIPEYLATLTEQYLLFGVESWSLVDEQGKPVEVTKPAIRERLLSNPRVAMVVGDAADVLYNEEVLLPLLAMASGSSPSTPTESSTSAATDGSTTPATDSSMTMTPLTPSSPSSTTTTPTDFTVVTSEPLVGASS